MRGWVLTVLIVAATSGVLSQQQPHDSPKNGLQQASATPDERTKPAPSPTRKQPAARKDSACASIASCQKINAQLQQENAALKQGSTAALNEVSGRYEDRTKGLEKEIETLEKQIDLQQKQIALLEKQSQLQSKDMEKGLAAGVLLNEVSGDWTIHSGTVQVVCSVQVYYDYHTIQLMNCH